MKHLKQFENIEGEESGNEVDIDFVIKQIKDRIINNVMINYITDDLDVTKCMEIIRDDFKNYKIMKK